VPRDFKKLDWTGVNWENIQEQILVNGKRKLSIVFNTDPSTKSGQHWICCFIEIVDKKGKLGSCSIENGKVECKNKKDVCSVADYKDGCKTDGTIEFYDSVGNVMLREISDFLLNVSANFCKIFGLDVCVLSSHVQTQYGDGQCGVYCLDFITRRLKGETFDDIVKKTTFSDDVMEVRRLIYMRPPHPDI
jgi:Ulp1 family protease